MSNESEDADIKWMMVARRFCEACRESVKHDIGAKLDGTPVKCCMRCKLLTLAI